MKVGDFVPELASRDSKLVQANTFLNQIYANGFDKFSKAYTGGNITAGGQVYGIEQLYWEWLRTAYAYRRQFIQDLYMLAFDSAEIRTPLLHLRNQIFKKGFEDWKPVFKYKCANNDCGKEFTTKIATCDACGGTQFRVPDKKQYEIFEQKKLKCNIFGQSLEAILKTIEDDLNIVDDAYIWINNEYKLVDGKLYNKVVEIRRIHPALVEYDLDKAGLPKNSHWICLFHRDDTQVKPGKCQACGKELVPVMYVWNHRGRRVYLPEEEIIHLSKFSASETYGYSMLLTIMQKVLTISGMDRFLYRYFFERRAPTGMIMTYTDDPQSLETERARVEAKMAEDPTYLPWIAVSQRTGRGRTDFVKLFHTLQEMDYLPVRNEIRDRIAAVYGVPQLYMNVIEGVGGISGQTQQLKVFNDVIQADQKLYNDLVFLKLMKAFGITDWRLELRPPEEKVEGQILQLAQQKVQIAAEMLQMGFKVELKPECEDMETLDFSFSGKAISQQEQMEAMQQAQAGAQEPGAGEEMPPERPPEEMVNSTTPKPAWEPRGRDENKAFGITQSDKEKPEASDYAERPFKNTQP